LAQGFGFGFVISIFHELLVGITVISLFDAAIEEKGCEPLLLSAHRGAAKHP
jgi:hypothetical protein